MLTVGVTGAGGFIGQHIIQALSADKRVRVRGFDRPRFDILKSADVGAFVKGTNAIIHAAAVNRGTDIDIVSATVAGTYNLIAAVSKLKKKPKIVFLSSVQAEKETVYGLSKRLAETMLKDFSLRERVPVSIFRIANVFGEGIAPFRHSVVATFSHQLHHGKKLSVNPDGKKFNFVYAPDLARTLSREALRPRATPFHFEYVSPKNVFSVSQIAALLKKFSGMPSPRGLTTKFERDLYRTFDSYRTT
jgi:UDP-2-acetamido-2,6-beta-L-arabino-hexul-4-ose reductase